MYIYAKICATQHTTFMCGQNNILQSNQCDRSLFYLFKHFFFVLLVVLLLLLLLGEKKMKKKENHKKKQQQSSMQKSIHSLSVLCDIIY